MPLFNRHLRGWLGLLDAKTNGLAPSEFSNLLYPQLDAYPFIYSQQRIIRSGTTTAVTSFGFFPAAALTVPADEVWRVEKVFGFVNTLLAAGEEVQWVPGTRSFNLAGNLRVTPLQITSNLTGATQGHTAEQVSTAPFVALPGDEFGASIQRRLVYAGTFDISVVYVPIKV